MMAKWVYRVSDGQWCMAGGPDPAAYLSDQVNYGLAVLPDDTKPNPRTQKWNGVANVARTGPEVAAYDAAAPLIIDGREVMRRLAASTHLAIEKMVQTDATVCKLWNTLKAGGPVDVHSVEFQQGAGYLKAVGIPSVWATEAAFNAEVAVVTA
jgi:hypothetical protein